MADEKHPYGISGTSGIDLGKLLDRYAPKRERDGSLVVKGEPSCSTGSDIAERKPSVSEREGVAPPGPSAVFCECGRAISIPDAAKVMACKSGGSSKGGKARSANMSPEELSEHGKKMALAKALKKGVCSNE